LRYGILQPQFLTEDLKEQLTPLGLSVNYRRKQKYQRQLAKEYKTIPLSSQQNGEPKPGDSIWAILSREKEKTSPSIMKMYLRFLTYNIHGLRNHLFEVLKMITEYNIDILLFQETWIKHNETTIDIDTRLATMGWQCWWYNNYRSKRQYNGKNQGGLAI
jgi:hypothetical protein